MLALLSVTAMTGCTGPVSPSTRSPASPIRQANGTPFVDADGRRIQAHGGGVLEHDGIYYWVGEDRDDADHFAAVTLYRSDDLVRWRFVKDILTPASSPELAGATVERPKLIFIAATGQFVLWMHWENGTDYSAARVAVATAVAVDGVYQYSGSFRPLGYESRDQTVFVDDDGTSYLVSATNANADLNLYRLSVDATEPVELLQTLFVGAFREAPALFKRGRTYFLLTSAATGWNPNQARYATTQSIDGAWSPLQDVGDAIAYGSQVAAVVPTSGDADTPFLYIGDRWAGATGGPVNDSGYVWLPLTFPTGDTLTLDWAATYPTRPSDPSPA